MKNRLGRSCLGETDFSGNRLSFITPDTPRKYYDTKREMDGKTHPGKHFSDFLYEHGYSSFAKEAHSALADNVLSSGFPHLCASRIKE